MKFLHQNGADINTKHNEGGWSSLHCAAYHGHLEVVVYLVQMEPGRAQKMIKKYFQKSGRYFRQIATDVVQIRICH